MDGDHKRANVDVEEEQAIRKADIAWLHGKPVFQVR